MQKIIKTTCFNHSLKALELIFVKEEGDSKDTYINDEQPKKASFPIVVIEEGIVIYANEEQQ